MTDTEQFLKQADQTMDNLENAFRTEYNCLANKWEISKNGAPFATIKETKNGREWTVYRRGELSKEFPNFASAWSYISSVINAEGAFTKLQGTIGESEEA